ncbi:protein FAM110A [Gouania willdenowi]|uniref:Protein FAM110A-like n=1 Tax=Gouania willdenowi TaxID=441366 RepID=A0A8C5EJP0_GOUWI|nr:protein FAM110A-like [Gouania willdenowi]XP_028309101.1 protein FAM110A-like [Gouania willdenowi]
MPVEAIQHSRRQIIIRNAIAASPPRLRPKGPVGPDFFRQSPTAAAAKPKQSAVERLEADKAKYVKSQAALSNQQQQQIRPPIARKPPLNPSTPLWPTRKTQPQPKAKPEGVQLDLKHLSNLISIGNDRPHPSAAVCSQEKGVLEGSTTITAHDQTTVETQKKAERPCPPPQPDWASPAKVRLKSTAPTRGDTSGPSGTVRRVDVMPQTNSVRTTCRPPLFLRQPLHPLLLHSKPPFRLAVSNLHPCDPRAAAGSSPLKPVVAPLKPINPAIPPTAGSPVPPKSPPVFAAFPPPSPAITRLSSSSSRKRPSLTRSKSDVSDRFSRAGTDLERFFNLCGLDPADLPELAGSSSDIVSLARFRSVSAPGSECAGSDRDDEEEEEEEDAGKAADRVPYGVSVIERNARVIKWLYGLRQAKDGTTKNTNP